MISASLRLHVLVLGLIGISSFRNGDGSYSMWTSRESSTWSENVTRH